MSIIVYKSQEHLLILSVSDSGAGPEDAGGGGGGGGDSSALPSGLGGASSGGKYVPPSMRGAGGTRIAGDVRGGPGNRDDLPTLRVTKHFRGHARKRSPRALRDIRSGGKGVRWP